MSTLPAYLAAADRLRRAQAQLVAFDVPGADARDRAMLARRDAARAEVVQATAALLAASIAARHEVRRLHCAETTQHGMALHQGALTEREIDGQPACALCFHAHGSPELQAKWDAAWEARQDAAKEDGR